MPAKKKRRRHLSPRELAVVGLLRKGRPYKAIAFELGIAESTARVHGSAALRKMGRSRLALQATA